MTELLKSLNRAAQKQQLVTLWSAQDSKMMCLSPGKPLDGKVCTSTSTPHVPFLCAQSHISTRISKTIERCTPRY